MPTIVYLLIVAVITVIVLYGLEAIYKKFGGKDGR